MNTLVCPTLSTIASATYRKGIDTKAPEIQSQLSKGCVINYLTSEGAVFLKCNKKAMQLNNHN